MMAQVPEIKGFYDVRKHIEEINSFVKLNPLQDHIYYFPNTFPNHHDTGMGNFLPGLGQFVMHDGSDNIVVAGSAALHYFQKKIVGGMHWEPTDADVFLLKSEVNCRSSFGIIDMVLAKEKTVEELLLNFDLGCCRAAFDCHLNLWVSIQCLSSIFTHKYPMPCYMKNSDSFVSYLSAYRTKASSINVSGVHGAENMMYSRFIERIKKYSDRGFGVTWIETTTVLPWIKNRFHYAEWKSDNEHKIDTVKMVALMGVAELIRTKCKGKEREGYLEKEFEDGLNKGKIATFMRDFERDSALFLMNKADRELCDALIGSFVDGEFRENNLLSLLTNNKNIRTLMTENSIVMTLFNSV